VGSTARPQPEQNRAPAASDAPHPAHVCASAAGRAAPQLAQNLAPAALAIPHAGQLTEAAAPFPEGDGW